jgi:signal transduction histidine kinase
MPDSSLMYYNAALEINKSLNYVGSMAKNYLNIANIYLDKKEFDKAKENLNKSLEICISLNINIGKAYNYLSLADVYLEEGNYEKAIFHADTAKKYIIQFGEAKMFEMLYEVYFNAYLKLENYKSALEYFQLWEQIKDSVINAEVHVKLEELQSTLDLKNQIQVNESLQYKNKLQNRRLYILSLIIGLGILIVAFLLVIIYIVGKSRRKEKQINLLLEEKNSEIEEQARSLRKLVATKDKLFSIIGHDLKNPFNAIMGFGNLLIDDYDNLSDKQRISFINHISNATNKANNLLENLLTWSTTQRGEIKVDLEIINIRDCINDQMELYKNTIKHKSISVVNSVNADAQIMTDRNMVCLVIRNLLNNALKFSNKEGNVYINIQEDNEYANISIKDEGVGMNKEVLKNLFNLEHNVTTKGTLEETGTGLGLVICHEFMKTLGGKIWAESEEGKGSTFYFSLPFSNQKTQS